MGGVRASVRAAMSCAAHGWRYRMARTITTTAARCTAATAAHRYEEARVAPSESSAKLESSEPAAAATQARGTTAGPRPHERAATAASVAAATRTRCPR